jgi:hypothetical protein
MKRFAVIPVLCILALSVTLHAKGKANNSPLVGTWNCVAHGTEEGDLPFTLYIEQSGDEFTGNVSAPQGDAGLSSVTFNDNHLKIAIDTEEHNYLLTATMAGGKLSGEWSVDGEKKGTWEGKK